MPAGATGVVSTLTGVERAFDAGGVTLLSFGDGDDPMAALAGTT